MVTMNPIVPVPGLAASSIPVEIPTDSLVLGIVVVSADGSVVAVVVFGPSVDSGPDVAGAVVSGSG